MSSYIILNERFCQAHEGHRNETGVFGYTVTLSGHYVAAEQSQTDFPELFKNSPYLFSKTVLELTQDDFPSQNIFQ